MKFKDLPTTDRNGRKLEPVKNGVIKSVSIGNEDRGCLTAWLHVEFDGGGCGFGGYKLGRADGGNLENGPTYAAEWIVRCLQTVLDGYGKWESLEGKPIRVLHEGFGGTIVAIGNYLKDEWFCPRLEFNAARQRPVRTCATCGKDT